MRTRNKRKQTVHVGMSVVDSLAKHTFEYGSASPLHSGALDYATNLYFSLDDTEGVADVCLQAVFDVQQLPRFRSCFGI